jgi:hypothetical protein
VVFGVDVEEDRWGGGIVRGFKEDSVPRRGDTVVVTPGMRIERRTELIARRCAQAFDIPIDSMISRMGSHHDIPVPGGKCEPDDGRKGMLLRVNFVEFDSVGETDYADCSTVGGHECDDIALGADGEAAEGLRGEGVDELELLGGVFYDVEDVEVCAECVCCMQYRRDAGIIKRDFTTAFDATKISFPVQECAFVGWTFFRFVPDIVG